MLPLFKQVRLLFLLLLGGFALHADQPAVNWTGNFEPCDRSSELLKRGHMDIGVRFNTANPVLVKEFQHAMDFWSKVLDMDWHEDDSHSCSIQIVDGTPELFRASEALVARSQFTDWRDFNGWIAFNRKMPLTRNEWYVTAIHEIGHMLGLKHNSSTKSVMYALNLEGLESLEVADLASLASRHKLRVAIDRPIAATRHPVLASVRDLHARVEP